MISKFLKYFSTFVLAGCFASAASAISCPEGQQDYNGVCKYLRTTSTAPAPFVPVAVKNKDNIFLYPTVMPAKCATAQADSDCVVAYSYTDTSLPAVISASFTNTAPIAGSTSTSPQWTSSNAVSMSISCSGVASSMAGSVALQGMPSGITFTSSATGTETCILTGVNPFGTSASVTISVVFAAAPPPTPVPTITVVRSPSGAIVVGQTQTGTYSTTNATSLTRICTAAGTGSTSPLSNWALSGTLTRTGLAAWVGYPTTCTWTAVGAGGTTVFTETLATIYALPTITVLRTPLPLTVGKDYSITWSTTNATSINVVCTASGTGYTYNGPQPVSGAGTGQPSAAWVGYPTHCVWTATGAGGTATAIDDFSTLAAPARSPVYRFQHGGVYFWTASQAEYQSLTTTYAYYWTYEGVAFYVYNTPTDASGLLPVYRFWNDSGGHFYTIYESEKNGIINTIPSYHLEGVGWYAFSNQPTGTVPLHRFYNPNNQTHFFTAVQGEKDWILASYPSWSYEGISHYVWP